MFIYRYGITPLLDAIHFDNHDVIKLLVKCGAHLALSQSKNVGEELCR
jgi:ankyrin repeat protein